MGFKQIKRPLTCNFQVVLDIVNYLRTPVLSLMTKFFPLPAAFKETCESSVPKYTFVYF